MTRVYGYARGSTSRQIESPEAQKRLIANYCQRLGLTLDGLYVDSALSGQQTFRDRAAGAGLLRALRRGDHVVIARLDRLATSLLDLASVLELWYNLGVIMHAIDMPGGVLDPSNPIAEMIVRILSAFAGHERKFIGVRTRESFARLQAEGRRCSRHAPFGYRWEKRGGKFFRVPVPEELALCTKIAELRAQGYSLDRVRQFLSYTLKAKNRRGNDFGMAELYKMAQQGARLLETAQSRQA